MILYLFRRHTNISIIALLVSIVSFHKSYSQEIRDLVYSQPQNTGLYLGFIYINEDQFALAGTQAIYLFSEENIIIDTLMWGNGGFSDNLYMMVYEDLDSKELNIATLNGTKKLRLNKEGIEVISEYSFTGNLKVDKVKFDMLIAYKDYFIARERKEKSFYLIEKRGETFIILDKIYEDWPISVNTFRGSEPIAFNKIQVYNNQLFIYDKRFRNLIIYDLQGKKSLMRKMPDHEDNEFIEFYIDPVTGKGYLFKYTDREEGTLYEYHWKDNTYARLLKTEYIVRGVYNRKLYVSGIFDGTFAHYLIPIYGQNEDVLFIDNN